MIDTILFDLDGTLLQMKQDEFIIIYFVELRKVFERMELDADLAIKALWAGTKAMITNDGSKLNIERFWEKFSSVLGLSEERMKVVEHACDRFYSNEFDAVKRIVHNNESHLPRQLISDLVSRGFTVVLATNPLFPTCAVTTRLRWIGLTPNDFSWITDYTNSKYCKPNHGYYHEILNKINKKPNQCLMIGNNAVEDMCAGLVGTETFLVTDYLENEADIDISEFKQGRLTELRQYLSSLPSVEAKGN